MRDFKKYIAQKTAKDLALGSGHLWMPGYDRIVIYTERTLRQKLDYIHLNPCRAGLAKRPEDWPWSSGKDYYTHQRGFLPVWKRWL
jgi:hypothetical protein